MQHFYTEDRTYVLDHNFCTRITNVDGNEMENETGTGCRVLGVILNTKRRKRISVPIPLIQLTPDEFTRRNYCLVLELRENETFVTGCIITKPVDARTAGRPSIHPNANAFNVLS